MRTLGLILGGGLLGGLFVLVARIAKALDRLREIEEERQWWKD